MEYTGFFDTIKLTPIIYTIVVIIGAVILICFGLYIAYDYSRGLPLKSLFWGRLKRWMPNGKNTTLFEIFNPINTVRFEYAHREMGDVYKFGESSIDYVPESTKKKGIFSKISNLFNNKITPVDSSLKSEVIIPKSVYSINNIPVVPLFEKFPTLNKDIKKGLEALKLKEINTLEELEFMVDDKNVRNNILFDDYTFEKFYELYMASKNKYELNITIKDVIGFMDSTNDANFRETIEAKDFNIKQNKKNNNIGYKIGIACLIIGFIVSAFIFVYFTVYR